MRLVGAREIASGFGILAQTKPTPWLWSRVGGDAMDLALLKSSDGLSAGGSTIVSPPRPMAVLGITAADLLCSTRMTAEPTAPYRGHAEPATSMPRPQ